MESGVDYQARGWGSLTILGQIFWCAGTVGLATVDTNKNRTEICTENQIKAEKIRQLALGS